MSDGDLTTTVICDYDSMMLASKLRDLAEQIETGKLSQSEKEELTNKLLGTATVQERNNPEPDFRIDTEALQYLFLGWFIYSMYGGGDGRNITTSSSNA